jgi:hypothetical protein
MAILQKLRHNEFGSVNTDSEAKTLAGQDSLPNTGMAVAIDVGDPTNVHPKNKAPVGERLTRIALANVYGRRIEYSGPVYESMQTNGQIVRRFTHLGGGLVAKNGPLRWLQVAGKNHEFFDADARIDGDSVVASSPRVKKPVAIRYAWITILRAAIFMTPRGYRQPHSEAIRGMFSPKSRRSLQLGRVR